MRKLPSGELVADSNLFPQLLNRRGAPRRPTRREESLRALPFLRPCAVREQFRVSWPRFSGQSFVDLYEQTLNRREQDREAVLMVERGEERLGNARCNSCRNPNISNRFGGCFIVPSVDVPGGKCANCYRHGSLPCAHGAAAVVSAPTTTTLVPAVAVPVAPPAVVAEGLGEEGDRAGNTVSTPSIEDVLVAEHISRRSAQSNQLIWPTADEYRRLLSYLPN